MCCGGRKRYAMLPAGFFRGEEQGVGVHKALKSRVYLAALQLFAERGGANVTISELAQAAGVARGTIYSNYRTPEELFEEVAAHLAEEMNLRVTRSFEGVGDAAQRLANGIRYYVRRGHDEPYWGLFINRFGFSNAALQSMWTGQPVIDLMRGLGERRYLFQPEQLASVVALIAGGVMGALFLVREGHRTWRDAGSDAAEMILAGIGIGREEARAIATAALPELASAE